MRKTSTRPKTMKQRFCIGATNDISPLTSEVPSHREGITFSSERELSLRTAHWPCSRLVQVWNRLPKAQAVKKFTDRRTAIHRIWRAIEETYLNPAASGAKQKIASQEV